MGGIRIVRKNKTLMVRYSERPIDLHKSLRIKDEDEVWNVQTQKPKERSEFGEYISSLYDELNKRYEERRSFNGPINKEWFNEVVEIVLGDIDDRAYLEDKIVGIVKKEISSLELRLKHMLEKYEKKRLNLLESKIENKLDEIITKINNTSQFDKTLYSRKEVCEMFNVTLPTLYQWEKSEILKNTKIGGRVYYTSTNLSLLLNR